MPSKSTPATAEKNGSTPASPEVDQANAAVEAMVRELSVECSEQQTDGANAALMMAAKILAAQTPEELSVGGKADHVRDLIDVPIEVESITFTESDYEDGYPFFALFHGKEVRTGKPVVVSCGGLTVVPAAYMLRKNGWLPTVVVFTEAKANPTTGYKPINLEVVGGKF